MLGPDFDRDMKKFGIGAAAFSWMVGSLFFQLTLVLAIAAGAYLAFTSANESLAQSLGVELTSGFVTFLFAPAFIWAARVYGWPVRIAALLAAIACGKLATVASGVWVGFLVEASASFILLVFIDLGLQVWMNALDKKAEEIAEAQAELEAEHGD